MPVKVGNSYVSEAALSFAQSKVADESNGGILSNLKEQFPDLKFQIGTAPFSGNGLKNISISPKILKEMQNNPDKKLEYEALLYDVANLNWSQNLTVKSSGVIIDDKGEMSMWSISKNDDGGNKRVKVLLDKNDKKSWWQTLLDEINAKKSAKIKSANRIDLTV
jgi:hypothetical protein